jgi:hypothetical protein
VLDPVAPSSSDTPRAPAGRTPDKILTYFCRSDIRTAPPLSHRYASAIIPPRIYSKGYLAQSNRLVLPTGPFTNYATNCANRRYPSHSANYPTHHSAIHRYATNCPRQAAALRCSVPRLDLDPRLFGESRRAARKHWPYPQQKFAGRPEAGEHHWVRRSRAKALCRQRQRARSGKGSLDTSAAPTSIPPLSDL